MAGNKVTLVFGGDADALSKAAKQAQQSTQGVADAATKSSKEIAHASEKTGKLTAGLGHLGSATTGAMDALDSLSGGMQALSDIENASANKAARLARAMNDVEQAQEDLQQALRDGSQAHLDADQATIDLKQANLDAAKAMKDYSDAVKEHGKNSLEAKQALIDLDQAQQDIKQANEDSAQATRDASQATIDAKSAQLDLNDANKEAHPPEMAQWSQDLQVVTPLLSALIGVVGLATGAQWLFNAALWASPITWIVLAIAALVAIIVIVATKTTFFQDTWRTVWGFLKDVGAWFAGPFADFFVNAYHKVTDGLGWVWDNIKRTIANLKTAFSQITDFIFNPFRAAFNLVASAWNNTIGRLRWTVPNWVPFVGGNSISAPQLPHFHTGGIVPGGLGAETLAVLQAGERVVPGGSGGGSHAEPILLGSDGSDFGDFLVDQLRKAIDRRGGDIDRILSNRRG